MPRGAPKGNQYAKKTKDETEQGISFTYYLDTYEYDFLKQSVEYDGLEVTDKNIRAKVKKLLKDTLTREIREAFARYVHESPLNQG